MTELSTFLTALYDALSEAETTAFRHGQDRLSALLADDATPRDVTVPVYHATDVNVSLDVGLEAEETESGTEVHIVDSPPEAGSALTFDLEAFDVIERRDVQDLGYEEVIDSLPETLPPEVPDVDGDGDGQDGASSPVDGGSGDGDDGSSGGDTHEDDEEDHEPDRDGGDDSGGEARGRDDDDDPSETDDDGVWAEVEDAWEATEDVWDETTARPVAAIEGIEQSVASVLERAGVETVPELFDRPTAALASAMAESDDDLTAAEARERLQAAREAARAVVDHAGVEPVDSLEGIGPSYGERLRAAGVESVAAVAGRSPEAVAEAASTDDVSVSTARARRWVERARERVASEPDATGAGGGDGAGGRGPDHDPEVDG
jgi:predicted flap endonuclease-1-like 5' DNA nuclease